MTLVDAGPLVALLDSRDTDHNRCREVLSYLAAPLITTWPVFTEAMYLLGHAGDWNAQEKLWAIVLRGDLRIEQIDESGLKRTSELMYKYRDVPMDLADATLVVLAEIRGISRVFSLDRDFHVFRLRGRGTFEVVP